MRKKLIEVALPLEAINRESAREKSIRHGHPSTLHLWWARRPLAACRAVLFASLVDDPSSHPDRFPTEEAQEQERQRLFRIIEALVKWENSNNEAVLRAARVEIQKSTNGNPPPVLDPFCGGGSIPLEAQRLGLEAHGSDLNPVAVLITKALIEIPPKFAGQPPVNPGDRKKLGRETRWEGAQGLAEDVRYYGRWMRDEAERRIGHLYPQCDPHPPAPSPIKGEGEEALSGLGVEEEGRRRREEEWERWDIPEPLRVKMVELARRFRKAPTHSEAVLWKALRRKQLEGRKFRRQQPIGPFVVDFYCSSERLIVEVDGPIHETQQEADHQRQRLLESLSLRFVRIPAAQVETDLPSALTAIKNAFLPSPLSPGEKPAPTSPSPPVGEGARGRGGATVIAWLWARTVNCPNPACGARMPLVRSFWLSKKKGKKAWVEPVVDRDAGTVRFKVKTGEGMPRDGTVNRRGAACIVCGTSVPFDHIRSEGKAGRMGAQLMAIVAEGDCGRIYVSPTTEHEDIAKQAKPENVPETNLPEKALGFRVQLYGMTRHRDLFTPRQLVALTTFSDLVGEAREKALQDAIRAGMPDDRTPLNDGGTGATAYADAVATYLAFVLDKLADLNNSLCTWKIDAECPVHLFARQAIPICWDYVEANPFSSSSGSWTSMLTNLLRSLSSACLPAIGHGHTTSQSDATVSMIRLKDSLILTDPPYYDNIGYADLSDFFYIWLRRSLSRIYIDLFGTLLTPKSEELVATPYRFEKGKDEARQFFEEGLSRSFTQMHKVQNSNYPLSIFYAFKQAESGKNGNSESDRISVVSSTGWETMLEGLLKAGFAVVGTWPMRTEMKTRQVAMGTNALASSVILVCRPRPDDAPLATRREFLNALKRELPQALKNLQHGNIAPVDLAQASIGPGMAVFSRYAKVLEADGSPMRVRTALALINQALDEILAEQEADLDADTRWALAWFEQFGMEGGPFGVAETLSKAKNTAVQGLVEAGILASRAGKVRLLRRDELAGDWDPATDRRVTVWEVTQYLIRALEQAGETGAARLAAQAGALAETARDLAYRLYGICERKKWAQEALAYNSLVIAWPEIARLAAHEDTTPERQISFLE